MPTLEQVNKLISSYRTSDYKWVRELTTLFEQYFDKEFRGFLTEKRLGGMAETEFKEIFLYSLDTLHNLIHSYEYYVGDIQDYYGIYVFSEPHPATKKDLPLNKEKAEKLFIMVTMPFRIFKMNISKHLISYYEGKVDTKKLDQDKRSLKSDIVKLEAINEARQKDYNKLAEDIQKEIRESIENMTKAYIETCKKFKTHKPTDDMLSTISGVEKRHWLHQRNNDLFLKELMVDLKKRYNQAKDKTKKDFWWDAVEFVDKRFEFTKDGYDFKKAGFNENIDYKNTIAKSVGQKRMDNESSHKKKKNAEINYPKKDIINCDKCYSEITEGYRCKKCIAAFGEKD